MKHNRQSMKFISLIFTILLTGLACGCSGGKSEGAGSKHLLAVSVEPQRAMLQEIAGDGYEVVTLLANGANPETFEPTMKTRMAIEKADAYFTTGKMPFETATARSLPETVRIVDTSAGIEPVYGTHDHGHGEVGHEHGEADPHTWVSVRNARVMAQNMRDALVETDPENADVFTANHARLDARLDSLDKAIGRRLEGAHKAFAVWHPSLSYFARDYGLKQISVGFENKEMSPKRIAHVRDEARDEGVRVFFFQKEYDSRQAETLNEAIGAKMVTINPMAYDWEQELTKIAEAMAGTPEAD